MRTGWIIYLVSFVLASSPFLILSLDLLFFCNSVPIGVSKKKISSVCTKFILLLSPICTFKKGFEKVQSISAFGEITELL